MKSIRFALSILVIVLLGCGYIASQVFYFTPSENAPSRAADWARMIDNPAIVWLALALLVSSIFLAIKKDPEEVTTIQ